VSEWDEMILVGRISRPHGLKGYVVVAPETDFVEDRFAVGSELHLGPGAATRLVSVASVQMPGGRLAVRFTGVERIEDVDGLVGQELRVPASALRALEAGRYYEHQLVGCAVETMGGHTVGTVRRVEGGAGGSRLVVEGESGEVLVPFVEPICREVDVAARRIRIDPPEGLLELNR
jgi:16S rRNA processing protein RimM